MPDVIFELLLNPSKLSCSFYKYPGTQLMSLFKGFWTVYTDNAKLRVADFQEKIAKIKTAAEKRFEDKSWETVINIFSAALSEGEKFFVTLNELKDSGPPAPKEGKIPSREIRNLTAFKDCYKLAMPVEIRKVFDEKGWRKNCTEYGSLEVDKYFMKSLKEFLQNKEYTHTIMHAIEMDLASFAKKFEHSKLSDVPPNLLINVLQDWKVLCLHAEKLRLGYERAVFEMIRKKLLIRLTYKHPNAAKVFSELVVFFIKMLCDYDFPESGRS